MFFHNSGIIFGNKWKSCAAVCTHDADVRVVDGDVNNDDILMCVCECHSKVEAM